MSDPQAPVTPPAPSETPTQISDVPTPLGDRCIVLRDAPDAIVGGIHLTQQAQQQKQTATVVKPGPLCPFPVGTRVLLPMYPMEGVVWRGVPYIAVTPDEVIGILADSPFQPAPDQTKQGSWCMKLVISESEPS